MTGSIDEVENILLAVFRGIIKANGARLDSDSSFTLNIHIIEELFFHITLRNGGSKLEDSVGKSRFAVIYMSNNAKISDIILII